MPNLVPFSPQSDMNMLSGSPNRRITQIPQQSPGSPYLTERSNRHTTIVGPSSPIHKFIPQSTDSPPPPVPGRDKRTLNRSPSSNSMTPSSGTVSIFFISPFLFKNACMFFFQPLLFQEQCKIFMSMKSP